MGKTGAEAFPGAVTADPEAWRELQGKMERREPFRGFQTEWTDADGSRRVAHTNGMPHYGEGGEF